MIKKFAIACLAATFLAGCTTTDPYTGEQKMSNTAGGALIGTAAGALAGLAVGGSGRAQRNAVLIGAGLGALGGGAIGNYMDRQESELRAQLQGTGVSVTRNGDRIILNMPSAITFNIDRDQVKPEFFSTLASVAVVLRKFDRTIVDVAGRTDSNRQYGTQSVALGAPRAFCCQLSDAAGHRQSPLRRSWLWPDRAGRQQCQRVRPRAKPPRRDSDFAAYRVESATAIFAARRALFSTRAMFATRLSPLVIVSISDNRNGVTALPVMPFLVARESASLM